MYRDRLDRLRDYLKEQHLDGVVISKPENIHYFSGFTGDDTLILAGLGCAYLVTDFRYEEQAVQEAPDFQLHKNLRGILTEVSDVINKEGMKAVGFEGGSLCFSWHRAIHSKLNAAEFQQSVNLDFLRQLKSEEELQCIRRAMDIGDEAFAYILSYIRPGISENDVAAALENAMRQKGSQRPSFATIVASGKRGSLPHGTATEKLINSGEFVTMDYGAVYRGYHSDMTRTICVGAADERQRRVYDTVLRAQMLGLSLIRTGASGKEVDLKVRRQLDAAGYGRYFGHGLGHGVGLEIHENPRLSPSSPCESLEENMVVTVEPGIYIPDWGGIRIEDSVAVKNDGCEILTRSPKDLIELGV